MNYRTLLEWVSRSPGISSNGTQTVSDDPKGVFWAKVETLTGWSAYIAEQRQAGANFQITIRPGPAIKPSDRLKDQASGRIFSVVTVRRGLVRTDPLIITASEDTNP